ncbi:hypothetical protein Tco_1195540 [Tanacetum coccineum]
MCFRLESLWVTVVYVLTTPIPEDGENATVEQIRKKAMWDNDDYVCRGLILNGMSDPLFDIYQNVKSSKELWDSLEATSGMLNIRRRYIIGSIAHYLLDKVVSVGTAPGPNSSDHNVSTITNGDGMPRMRTFRETIFPE